MDGNVDYWKKKYEDAENNLQTLKDLAHKGERLFDEYIDL